MYAVIKSGGKQHRVKAGDVINLEKLAGEPGDELNFEQVLMVANGEDVKIGAPYLSGAKVTAEILEQGRGDKITVIKFRRRQNSRTTQGHRQWLTQVKIKDISL